MTTLEREHIGRLIRRFAAGAATDDLLILIAEHSGLLEACKQLLAETKDPVTAAWLKSECEAAKTRPGLFQAEIEAVLTIIKPRREHADLYASLELEPGAGREAIKRNYRRLSRRYHPDSGGSKQDEDTFIRITQAYQRLLASADSTPGELPTPRRENSHWRNSVVAGTSDLRRTQKRRNVVVVALLSLTLIFVSLLAARTYNSRVMMSGLKNKGVAFVPPTPTTAATTPTPKSPEKHVGQPDRTAATPKSPEGHATDVGCGPRTNCTPAPTTTAAATNRTAPTTNPTPAATTPTPKSPEGHTANDGYAARTNGTPTSTTTTAATEQTEPTTKPITAAATDRAVSTANTPSSTTTTATAILPAEPAAHPETLVSLTPTARKQPVSPAHAEPGTPTTPTAEPAAQQPIAATQPSAAAHAATAGQTAHTESTPPAPTIATTTAQPLVAPPPPKPTPSTPTLTATQPQPAPTTTDHQPPSPASVVAAAAAPQPLTASQTRERIDTFLQAYTAAYEQKNLPTFTRFFATNATENGKPLTDVLSAYAELFHSAETLRFTVSPEQYEHNQGHLHLRGRFTIAMTFKDEGTKSGQGEITFRLTDTTPPQVQTLRYTFVQ